jgi:hypothetical protein
MKSTPRAIDRNDRYSLNVVTYIMKFIKKKR